MKILESKNLLPLLLLLGAAPSFAAVTYDCDPLKDASGNVHDVGGFLSVIDPGETSYELPRTLTLKFLGREHGPSYRHELTLSDKQSSEGAIYTSDQTGFEVIYSIAPAMRGLPSRYVSVREEAGGVEYKGGCQPVAPYVVPLEQFSPAY